MFEFRKFRCDTNIGKILKDEIIKIQKNSCAICENDFSYIKKHIHIDHNHSSNMIRGILCKARWESTEEYQCCGCPSYGCSEEE